MIYRRIIFGMFAALIVSSPALAGPKSITTRPPAAKIEGPLTKPQTQAVKAAAVAKAKAKMRAAKAEKKLAKAKWKDSVKKYNNDPVWNSSRSPTPIGRQHVKDPIYQVHKDPIPGGAVGDAARQQSRITGTPVTPTDIYNQRVEAQRQVRKNRAEYVTAKLRKANAKAGYNALRKESWKAYGGNVRINETPKNLNAETVSALTPRPAPIVTHTYNGQP